MNMLEDLESLQFEYGIQEEDHSWLYLQGRFRGLMIKACAHATFFCKLLLNLQKEWPQTFNPQFLSFLKVGIIGGGNLGKQLARVLLQLVPIPAENLRISTRRPEVLGEEQRKLGIQCFYHNPYLVDWANVLFLCCLPSQLPNICLEIQTHLEKGCIVYSFVAAVPIARLKLLLNHTNILRPQYQCVENVNIWGAGKDITAALQDPVILQATCPYSAAGGIILNIKWLEGVFHAALNICTAKDMPHLQVLQLLNELFLSVHFEDCEKDEASCPKFQLQDFVDQVYTKNLPQRRPFPWFDLTAVQLKETPFTQHFSTSTAFRDHLTYLYCDLFGISFTKEQQPGVSTSSSSK
uniref:NADP-dependent oxidoreductase domain-containing protein 1 n=1 Tax=Canis lupus dingo TaxID=286419 RepID=A0A8C0JL47_CANLU